MCLSENLNDQGPDKSGQVDLRSQEAQNFEVPADLKSGRQNNLNVKLLFLPLTSCRQVDQLPAFMQSSRKNLNSNQMSAMKIYNRPQLKTTHRRI